MRIQKNKKKWSERKDSNFRLSTPKSEVLSLKPMII